MQEQYKVLEDFPQYHIYPDGRIWSEYIQDFMHPTVTSKGYLKVVFYNNGIEKHFRVHRLVATLFLDNPNNYPDVNHKDENKQNNQVSNLEWCTKAYNNTYGNHAQHVGAAQGKEVYCIELDTIYPSAEDAGRTLKIDGSNIRKACNGTRKTAGGYHWSKCK